MLTLVFFASLFGIFLLNRKLFGGFVITDLFTIMWFGAAGLSNTGMLDLAVPSFEVSVLALASGYIFNAVYIAFRMIKNETYHTPDFTNNFTSYVNFPLLLLLNMISWVICMQYLPTALNLIATSGFEGLRAAAYNDYLDSSVSEMLLISWVFQSIFNATTAITVASLVLGLKNRFKLLIIDVIDIAMYALLLGGRGVILRFVTFLGVAVLVRERGSILSIIKRRWKLLLLALIPIGIMFWLTTQRSMTGLNPVENVYMYYVAPFTYMTRMLEAHPVGELTLWGAATFNFVLCFVCMAGKIFFNIDYNAGDQQVISQTSVTYSVSSSLVNPRTMNAMPTMMYPFLLDFGYVGIFLGTAVFVLILAIGERMFYKRHTLRSYALLIYFGHIIIASTQNYTFYKPDASMMIIMLLLMTTRFSMDDGVLHIG